MVVAWVGLLHGLWLLDGLGLLHGLWLHRMGWGCCMGCGCCWTWVVTYRVVGFVDGLWLFPIQQWVDATPRVVVVA